MTFTKEELELYDKYLNYLKNELDTKEIKWNQCKKWSIILNNKIENVISYHQWKIMVEREEKLNELFS